MSAASAFMEALALAEKSQGRYPPATPLPGRQVASTMEQGGKPLRERPPLNTRDSLDDLFSDSDSVQVDWSHEDIEDPNPITNCEYASAGDAKRMSSGHSYDDIVGNEDDLLRSDEDSYSPPTANFEVFGHGHPAKPYNPHKPSQFYEDFRPAGASPEISTDTPFFTPHGKAAEICDYHSPTGKSETAASEKEILSAKIEEEQIAYFGDKAFRKALREVEPSLSREQQHYAWVKGYQDNRDIIGDGDFENPVAWEPNAATPEPGSPPNEDFGPDSRPYGQTGQGKPTISFFDESAESDQSGLGYGLHITTEAKQETFGTLNSFYPHHSLPTPISARTEAEEREKQAEIGLEEAIRACERNKMEQLTRESEVDEANTERKPPSLHKREWSVENSDDSHEGSEHQDRKTLREALPIAAHGSAPLGEAFDAAKPKHRTRVVPPFPAPRKDFDRDIPFGQVGSAGGPRQSIGGSWLSRDLMRPPWEQGLEADRHDSIETLWLDGYPIETTEPPRAPWLDPKDGDDVPSPPWLERDPPVDSPFGPRKAIEPETPASQRIRHSTPAYEDRSPSPSPPTRHYEFNDADMQDAPMATVEKDSSPDPLANLERSRRGRQSLTRSRNQSRDRRRSASRYRSKTPSPTKNPPVPPLPVAPSPGAGITTLSAPKSRTAVSARRKSGIQGLESKISKPAPKSRNVTRKVTTAPKKAVSAEIDHSGGASKVGKVRAAIAKIEAKEEQVKDKGTPPSRRSRRLRGDTPEVEDGV